MEGAHPVAEIAYYANGNVKHRGAYLEGEMHGPWEFFRTDGSMMRSGGFERGRQVGVWRTFDRGSNLVKETDLSRSTRPASG